MVEAVIVGGISPYTYSWSTGSFNRVLTGLAAGTYTFTVTDATNQTVSANIELIQPAVLQLNFILSEFGGYNISEQGGSDGFIETDLRGGSQPYSFAWSNSSNNNKIDGLSAGSYSVIITDANGCSVSKSQNLTEPTPLHVVSITSPQHHGYNVSCKGGNDGQIDLTVTGGVPPYKYDWNTGSFDEDISELGAGEYSVRITDGNNAEIIANILLTQAPIGLKVTLTPQLYANGYNLSCHDCANGSITGLGSGGTAPFTYLWSNSLTSATISGLQAIEYTCTLTDVNGCSVTERATLHAPDRDDWSMNGNANTDPTTQFMGTTDNKDFVIKTSGNERVRFLANGGLISNSLSGSGYDIIMADSNGLLFRQGANISIPCQSWSTCGNSINAASHFLGTSNLMPIIFKTANTEQMRLLIDGKLGIGTSNPSQRLEVQHNDLTGGISIDQFDSNHTLKPSEIKFKHNGVEQWALGSHLSQVPSGPNSFFIWNNSPNQFRASIYIDQSSNNVGVNTITPSEKLEIDHNDIYGGMIIKRVNSVTKHSEIKFNWDNMATGHNVELYALGCDIDRNGGNNFFIRDNFHNNMPFYINENGDVGIQTIPPASNSLYNLYVEGGIATRDIKVTNSSTWPDFVFKDEYKLMPISELKEYIKKNNHLPGLPSSNEIEESSGFEIGEMQLKILQKIEEQSLYIIELQKQINELRKSGTSIKNKRP